jgi:hypothetical protein
MFHKIFSCLKIAAAEVAVEGRLFTRFSDHLVEVVLVFITAVRILLVISKLLLGDVLITYSTLA